MAETMEKLELGDFNIFYTGVAVWDSNVWVTWLLNWVRYLVHIHLTGLQLSLLPVVLVLLFGLAGLLLTVLN